MSATNACAHAYRARPFYMKAIAPAPPCLATLHTQPTWHNRAGRVDRSACFVVTASKLWRLIPDDDWRNLQKMPPVDARGQSRGPSAVQARRLTRGRADRVAALNLCAHDLWIMHRFECPHPLQGDCRTSKSNAMRPRKQDRPFNGRPRPTPTDTPPPPHDRGPSPDTCSQIPPQTPDTIDSFDQHPLNPNRGVGFALRHKVLGLDAAYETTLTIQRIVQHARLKQHFLVCPACPEAVEQRLDGRSDMVPPSSRCSTAAKLPGRASKLFLPLCTEREWEDAQVAHLWLRTHPRNITHPNRPLSQAALQLITRYAELFPPRLLRCRQCLGLRYGEVKPHPSTKRQRVTPSAINPNHSLTLRARTTLPPLPPAHNRSDQTPVTPSPGEARCRPNNTSAPEHAPADPPKPDHDALLLELAELMPSFKALALVKLIN